MNAVIVNLENIPLENRRECLDNIEDSVKQLKAYLEENLALKGSDTDVPATGMAVLQQQYILAQTIEEWLESLQESSE